MEGDESDSSRAFELRPSEAVQGVRSDTSGEARAVLGFKMRPSEGSAGMDSVNFRGTCVPRAVYQLEDLSGKQLSITVTVGIGSSGFYGRLSGELAGTDSFWNVFEEDGRVVIEREAKKRDRYVVRRLGR